MIEIKISFSNEEDPIIHASKPRYSEQGAAIIVVLLFLIFIMLAGVIAVRQSTTDLKTAMADQINTVLLHSADSPNQRLESIVNGSPDSVQYKDLIGATGVFGYFLASTENMNKEFIYCIHLNNNSYLLNSATVKDKEGNDIYNNGGVCDYNNPNDYTSAKQNIITQVNITTSPDNQETQVFSQYTIGKEIEDRTAHKIKFDVRSIAAIPSFGTPAGCFAKTSIPKNTTANSDTIISCLHTKNIPSKMIYTQIELENLASTMQCAGYGKKGMAEKCIL